MMRRRDFLSAPALAGNLISQATATTPLWKEGISLIPYPQEVGLSGDDFHFEGEVGIVLDPAASAPDRFAAGDLAARLTEGFGITARVGSQGKKSIGLSRQGAPGRAGDQGYTLAVERDRITVRANSEPGLFYGTRTLLQVIQKSNSGVFVKGMQVTDWPDIPERAVHYDTKHHQDKAEYVREFIRTLAGYKINMLLWEWEDKFAYPSHPEIGAPGAFSMEEMQALTRYARQYHVQLVPLVQGLGHVSFILKWPQHAHLRELAASNWEFCPRKEGSYKLLLDLWEDAMKATPGSTYIHMGIVGEIGTERRHITPAQERVFRAAALAQRRTGACIMTHTTHFGELAMEQIALLREESVPAGRIAISHLGDRHDTTAVLKIARQGVFISIDNIGYVGNGYPPDEVRMRNVGLLAAQGHLAQIVLSGDICQKSHLAAFGGKGYAHVQRCFLPLLRAHGIREDAIHQMTVANAARMLNIEENSVGREQN
jgi:predicted metal-dependent phosphotriesterase family hydrolase